MLWQILRGDGHSIENSRKETIDFGRIYFDIVAETFLYRVGIPPNTAIPVVHVLSSRWRSHLSHLGTRLFQRARNCRRQLLDYRVWFTFLDDVPLEYVRESFVRVNSLGTPIGTADRAFARAARMDLRRLIHEAKHQFPVGLVALSDTSVLMTIAMVRDQSDIGGRAIDMLVKKIDTDNNAANTLLREWPTIKNAIGLAIDYLCANFGVANYGFLASDYIVTILAVFYYHNKLRRPSSAAARELRRWFWATMVGSRYAGRGFRPKFASDAKFMKRLATTERAHFSIQDRVPLYVIQRADYSRRSMITDGYFCLLRLQHPKYLEDGPASSREPYYLASKPPRQAPYLSTSTASEARNQAHKTTTQSPTSVSSLRARTTDREPSAPFVSTRFTKKSPSTCECIEQSSHS